MLNFSTARQCIRRPIQEQSHARILQMHGRLFG